MEGEEYRDEPDEFELLELLELLELSELVLLLECQNVEDEAVEEELFLSCASMVGWRSP